MNRSGLDIDRLRAKLFLHMMRARADDIATLSTEEAALLGEHAARLAKAAMDGMGFFDRTGQVRDPRPQTKPPFTP
jgi:hypothetical protein